MAENDIIAYKELASGGYVERVLAAADIAAATSAQGSLADSAVQPGDLGTIAAEDLDALPETLRIVGGTDPTKKVAFEVDGLTTATTRTLTVPNASGTIALNETFAAPPAIGSTTPAAGTFTTLAANNGTLAASAPVLDLAQTWNNAAVPFTGLRVNYTNTFSSAASRLIDLQVDGISYFSVQRSGTITGVVASGGTLLTSSGSGAFDINATSGNRIRFATGTAAQPLMFWAPNGKYQFFPSAATANTSLGLFLSTEGTNNVMALENAANPQTFRLYNTHTSATNFERLNLRWASNELIIDAEAGSVGGTLRGIKLGSASTSLLGFFGATPVVRGAAVADATDAASTQARLNDLLVRVRTLGLIDT